MIAKALLESYISGLNLSVYIPVIGTLVGAFIFQKVLIKATKKIIEIITGRPVYTKKGDSYK